MQLGYWTTSSAPFTATCEAAPGSVPADRAPLCHDPRTNRVQVVLNRLMFANGVALGPGDKYVTVNETLASRITRYWLRGPKAGQSDLFASALPGYPDNLTYNGRGLFWVALPSPRSPALEGLAGWPWLRKVLQRLPAQLREQKLGRMAWVLAFNTEGRVVHNLQDPGKLRASDQRD